MLPARVVQATKASVIPDYRMNQLGKEENPYVTLDCDYTWNYLYTFSTFLCLYSNMQPDRKYGV